MRKLRRAHQRQVRQQAKRLKKFKNGAVAAGTAAVITLGVGVSLNKALGAYTPDRHQFPVAQDADADLLADAEELAMGYRPLDPDQNRNQIPDGVDLAKCCSEVINQLPFGPDPTDPNKPYIEHWGQFGLETCDICGATVNMGPAWIVNPKLGLRVDCPLIAMHYIEHGSFSFAGDVHRGRVDVPALVRALESRLPFEPDEHQMPVANDADEDLLANAEEYAIGYRPFNPDQNRNQIPDGVNLAKRCADVINELPEYDIVDSNYAPPTEPYKLRYFLRGLDQCNVCGRSFNMGGWIIINPKLNLTYPSDAFLFAEIRFLPCMAVHYMEHGSFSYSGDVNRGRPDLPRLLRTIELRYPHDPNEHQLPLDYAIEPVGQLAPDANDHDGDLLADSEELGADLNLYDADQDEDLTPDGIELAKHCKVALDSLPEYDSNNPPLLGIQRPYKYLHRLRGYETCEICGLTIQMNYWEVVNPRRGYLTIDVLPVMAAHYMEHGSFSYAATYHKGRVNVPLLLQILEMPRRCGHLGTIYLPGDLDKDCKVNFKDVAKFADRWLDSTEPN